LLFLYSSHPPPSLPSFPTRRSSDLFRTHPPRYPRLTRSQNRLLIWLVWIKWAIRGSRGPRSVAPTISRVLPMTSTLPRPQLEELDRKSTRLNSSHDQISYAVFCLKK